MATDTQVRKPFTIGSHFSSRASIDTGSRAIGAALVNTGPMQVPAVGFLAGILLDVRLTATDGVPALLADAPFSAIERINFRNSKGDNLITPVSGYDLYLINKYGAQIPGAQGPFGDPKVGPGYTSTAASPRFFLWLPLSIDASQALGVVPATASNNNYQIEITLNAVGGIWGGAVTVGTAQISGSAYYFDQPNDATFSDTPMGLPTASIWNVESPTVAPGERLVQSFNTGNIIRNHIFVVRNAAGARVDADWPALATIIVDNVDRLRLPVREWEYLMSRWYGLTNATKDAALGLDNGVFVIPWHCLLGGEAGDPSNVRDQLLQTQTTTQLQFRMQNFGATASVLRILTQSIATTDLNALYSKD